MDLAMEGPSASRNTVRGVPYAAERVTCPGYEPMDITHVRAP